MADELHSELIESARRQAAGMRARRAAANNRVPGSSGIGGWRIENRLDSDALPNYTILREIHRGGQGVVYLGIQQSTKREVAIKVMREGPLAGGHQHARFEREIEILGGLRHPNIVTIHDSGSAAGFFYYVMNYVPGQSLDAYVSANRPPVRELLELFIQICDAVNAAHLRGVIHRDLKPTNIRINEKGEPFVLDFGLAKRETEDGPGSSAADVMTQTGQFVGSAPWASPEQAEGLGDAVDTRTDVYSLGIVLYHALTGDFPYPVTGGMKAILDHIVNATPARPSTVRDDVDDELETIILKCLSKETARRYQSAGELARDLRRYLAGDAIEAKRDSATYLLRKMMHRHRFPFVVAACAIVIVTASAVSLGVMYRRQVALNKVALAQQAIAQTESARANRHAEEARERFVLARDAAEFMLDEASERLAGILGTSRIRHDLLQQAYERFESLTESQSDDPDLQSDLGRALTKLGEIAVELGELDKADEHLTAASNLYQRLADENPDSPNFARLTADAQMRLGRLRLRAGRLEEARELLQRANATFDMLLADHEENDSIINGLSLAYERLADVAHEEGNPSEERAWIEKMHALKIRLVESVPDKAQYQLDLAVSFQKLCHLARAEKDQASAESHAKRSLEIRERLLDEDPDDAQRLRALSNSFEIMAFVARDRGDLDEARSWTIKMYEIKRRLVELEPANPLYQHDLAITYSRLGEQARLEKDQDRALDYLRKAMEGCRKICEAEPDNARYHSDYAASLDSLAVTEDAGGDVASAMKRFAASVEIRERLAKSYPENLKYRQGLAWGYHQLGLHEMLAGNVDRAVELLQKASKVYEHIADVTPNDATQLFALSSCYRRLAVMAKKSGDTDALRSWYEKSFVVDQRLTEIDPTNETHKLSLVAGRQELSELATQDGRTEEARSLMAQCLETLKGVVERNAEDSNFADYYAGLLLTCEPAELRDPAAALVAAENAVRLTDGQNPSYLATLAHAQSQNEQIESAIETAERALGLLPPEETVVRPGIESALKEYRTALARATSDDPDEP